MGNNISVLPSYIEKPSQFSLQQTIPLLTVTRCKRELTMDDVCFLKMKSITFEDESPRKEALENVFSTMRIPFINVLYLIRGEKDKVTFYYGISRDLVQYSESHSESVDIDSIALNVLKRGLESNFRGSNVQFVDDDEEREILDCLRSLPEARILEGVAGSNGDGAEDFQRVERLVDVMLGDEFMFLVIAKYLPKAGIEQLERNVYSFYNELSPLSKSSSQKSMSSGFTESSGETSGESRQSGYNESHGKQNNIGSNDGSSDSYRSYSKTESKSSTSSKGTSSSSGTSKSVSSQTSKSENSSTATTTETIDKRILEWLSYTDETILKRIDYGKGKGIFSTAISLFAENVLVAQKLSNTATSLFSGETGNRMPLTSFSQPGKGDVISVIRNLQIPLGCFSTRMPAEEQCLRTVLSQYTVDNKMLLANWCSINELGILAGLPCKEVVGLSLNEEVEFGLNIPSPKTIEDRLNLGCLIQSGTERRGVNVFLDKRELSKHIFICGVTGSGKTTTCMSILNQSNLPFLVIEPAKTEYRQFANSDDGVVVFTLGKDEITPFRLNPLEFLPSETISSHIDMLKASIESAFDMEAAIPQIIESALYKCYANYGWDVLTCKNFVYSNPFDDGVYAFPTLSDLIRATEDVVKEQGFDERLKNDYLGSIKARLMGLTVGAKGLMLNTPRSIDFRDLLHRKVIIELENIKSGSEKSLIMGFILSQLNEAIKEEFAKDSSFMHVSLIEEAHRLLSKYTAGDSLNKKNGVEVFSDMLAEIRKYGECLVIADQIPDKMTPDVLKNTNTKIVHRIFAQDDKEAIGNTISLTPEQKSFLSNLSAGRAVVFSQGWSKSIQVQVAQTYDTTNGHVDVSKLRYLGCKYYSEGASRGVFPELLALNALVTPERTDLIFDNLDLFRTLSSKYLSWCSSFRDKRLLQSLGETVTTVQASGMMNMEEMARYINYTCYKEPDANSEALLLDLLSTIVNDSLDTVENNIPKYKLLVIQKSRK